MSGRLDDAVLPLTNVVFLLLIFFMLAGQLAAPSPMNVEPPHSASQTPADRQGIELELAADGGLAVDGHRISQNELEDTIREHMQRHPNVPIRLRADADLATSRVVQIMHILHAAGADRLRLITQTPRG